MSLFYKINRFNKKDFHKPISLKNTGDGIENNNGDFNKITESITAEGETKDFKNDGHTLSVAFGSIKGKDSRKIAEFFLAHADEPFTPKQLSFFLKIGHSSAKMACLRFLEKGYIEQPLINHYQYKRKITAEELEIVQKYQNLTLHNIMLVVGHTSGHTSGVTRVPATNPKNLERKIQIGEIQVKIFNYPKKAVMYIECSTHPLDAIDFNRVIGMIEGKGYDLTGAEIRRAEVNIDSPDLQISGTNCIELRTFQKAWQRMYNKGRNLREEIIIRGAQIPLEEAIAALRGKQALGTNALLIELKELREESKISNTSRKELTQVVGSLLKQYDKMSVAVDKLQKKLSEYQ